MQEKLRAEELAREEAECRAAVEREAAELANERLVIEVEMRKAEEDRLAAERRAIDAARVLQQTEVEAIAKADEARARYEREEADAKVAAKQLIERMSRSGKELVDWRVRAESVLADAPATLDARHRPSKILATALVSVILTVGIAGAMTWGGMEDFIGKMFAAAPEVVHAGVPITDAKLHLSYELKAVPVALEVSIREGRLAGAPSAAEQASVADKDKDMIE